VTEFLTRNLGWKIFSLGVAMLLWVTFARDPELGGLISVPVEYKGMPDNLEISSDAVNTVTLDVRGPGDKLRQFSASPNGVVLDFSNILKPGEQTFQIDERNVNLPIELRLVRAIPAQIRFVFEARIQREVPVQVRFGNPPPTGYTLRNYTVEPDTMMVVGPASRVQSVDFAVTDPIDLSTVVGETTVRVNMFVDDPQVRFAKPGRATVKVSVEKQKGS
jgi:YbbR domain-containing protein